MSLLEISGNIITVLSVFLAARNHVLTWPVGIAGSILYGVMFFETKLYADVTLQLFFIVTSMYGWWHWRKHKGQPVELPITRISKKSLLLIHFPAALVTAAIYGAILHYHTDASFPFIDSVILTFSVVGQLLLMNRKLECWFFWIIVDLLATPLYFVKELYMTSGVYALFFLNAMYGYWVWRRTYRKQTHEAV